MLIYADRAGLWCRPPLSEKDIGPHLGGWALYPHIYIHGYGCGYPLLGEYSAYLRGGL